MKQRNQNSFRDTWKDYFSFNNRVRKGLLVLFGLILILILILLYLHYTPDDTAKIDFEKFNKEVANFYTSVKNNSDKREASNADSSRKKFYSDHYPEKELKPKPELFSFNPNNLPESDWKRLGFSDKQIHSIKNYESKGGKFRTKADVKKMYAIHDDEYNRIEPFIAIPEVAKDTSHHFSFPKYEKTFLVVDIGTADSTELEKLPMVGDYLARKIYNWREKLGGFYSINQVKEMYGMRDSAFQVILPHLVLKDSANLRKINLNTADYVELNKHPYISGSLANIIVNYRKQHGAFKSLDDLHKVALVDGELYRKIAPYLKTE